MDEETKIQRILMGAPVWKNATVVVQREADGKLNFLPAVEANILGVSFKDLSIPSYASLTHTTNLYIRTSDKKWVAIVMATFSHAKSNRASMHFGKFIPTENIPTLQKAVNDNFQKI